LSGMADGFSGGSSASAASPMSTAAPAGLNMARSRGVTVSAAALDETLPLAESGVALRSPNLSARGTCEVHAEGPLVFATQQPQHQQLHHQQASLVAPAVALKGQKASAVQRFSSAPPARRFSTPAISMQPNVWMADSPTEAHSRGQLAEMALAQPSATAAQFAGARAASVRAPSLLMAAGHHGSSASLHVPATFHPPCGAGFAGAPARPSLSARPPRATATATAAQAVPAATAHGGGGEVGGGGGGNVSARGRRGEMWIPAQVQPCAGPVPGSRLVRTSSLPPGARHVDAAAPHHLTAGPALLPPQLPIPLLAPSPGGNQHRAGNLFAAPVLVGGRASAVLQ